MTRRQDGLWQEKVPVRKNGRTTYKYFYGRTKTEVNKKIAAFRETAERGETFGAVADEWWNQHEPTLASNTLKQYLPAFRRAQDYFGDAYIKEIKPTDVNVFLRETIAEMHMADKTARTQLMIVNLICKYAVANGYADFNPARDLSVPKGLQKTPRLMPSDSDIRAIKENRDLPFGMFAYWLLYTGLRRGELLALRWEDVDLERRTISVTKSVYQVGSHPHIKEPKTEAGKRTVPILDKLAEVIAPKQSGLVFQNAAGDLYTEMQYQRAWARYAAAAGITCTAHQLRHAYATLLFEAGIDVKDAQNILGHAQASTTQDIYTEVRKAREKKVYDKLLNADLV